MSLSFFVLYDISQKKSKHILQKRAYDISKLFVHECRYNGLSNELIQEIETLGFKVQIDKDVIDNVLKNQNLKKLKMYKKKREMFEHFELDERLLIYINTPLMRAILEDTTELHKYKTLTIIVYLFIVFVFIFLYLTIMQKLKPLKELKDKVKNLGDEEFDIEPNTTSADEISQLSHEFYKSAQKLKQLKEARNVFIRNIMHELKTPITKGKFLLELPKNKENEEKMQKVFYRLESLINEFATIEELIGTKKIVIKKEYLFDELLENAIDILMCDEDEVTREYESFKVPVDFHLFTIALKNLLDNGIKHSLDKKVMVQKEGTKIFFINSSQPLAYSLENYFEPFFKGEGEESFGLGLYILKHILDAHGFLFGYEYKDGKSYFFIDFGSVL
jgi:two-component system OmpR family sensor kinase